MQAKVFPTRVGMYRTAESAGRIGACFPHTRGDVPHPAVATGGRVKFSPHAWGCTVIKDLASIPGFVFPTRVGMYRAPRHPPPAPLRFPHTRGDVPITRVYAGAAAGVFPTRVGMYRHRATRLANNDGFPHTRGDVPVANSAALGRCSFSPHAWGCTVGPDGEAEKGVRFPHTRGDVPADLRSAGDENEFSPHAWGCTVGVDDNGFDVRVFPTRVGMYRTL